MNAGCMVWPFKYLLVLLLWVPLEAVEDFVHDAVVERYLELSVCGVQSR